MFGGPFHAVSEKIRVDGRMYYPPKTGPELLAIAIQGGAGVGAVSKKKTESMPKKVFLVHGESAARRATGILVSKSRIYWKDKGLLSRFMIFRWDLAILPAAG